MTAVASLPDSALWRKVSIATVGATFALMFLGALTRASMAGLSCPDWPLCHGFVIPPVSDAAYPPAPNYTAYQVYLEFGHRVIAGVVALTGVLLGVRAWRARQRTVAVAVWTVLLLQVAMGAVTVLMKNQPFTVVLHLLLALLFVTALLALHSRVMSARLTAGRRSRAELVLAAVVFVQLLIGAAISSQRFGLACSEFPLCLNGQLIPDPLTAPQSWQLVHRTVALFISLGVLALFGRSLGAGEELPLRRAAFALLLVGLQLVLGALNIWLRVPPLASALHLAVGAALFAVLVSGLIAPKRVLHRREVESEDGLLLGEAS